MICVECATRECNGCMRCVEDDGALHCELCGGVLWDEYYDIDGMLICPECINDSRRFY